MAAMKPRTGEGPLEARKEGRGIVMRVPLEGGGRIVVALSADQGTLSTTVAATADAAGLRAFVESLLLATYTFTRKSDPKKLALTRIDVVHPKPPTEAFEQGVATATAVRRARDLANTPSLEKSPAWLADQAVAMANKAGLTASVRGVAELESDGFGGVLAVGAGSARP